MLIIGLVVLCCRIHATFSGDAAVRLHRDLVHNYNPICRPVKNEQTPVMVQLGIILQQIIDIDEKNQVIRTNLWLNFKWVDELMVWEPERYNGITELRLSPGSIWKPDVLLYNSLNENFNSVYQVNVVVYNNGSILWMPPGILESSCKINTRWFPFDEQQCKLKFGSWTYHSAFLNLSDLGVDMSGYVRSGEWDLKGVFTDLNNFHYDYGTFQDLTVTIWVRRRILYYSFNLILPIILIGLMSLLVFYLPPEAGEKLSLGITIFMSLCVYLLMVADSTPTTSDAVPLLGILCLITMLAVTWSLVFTVLVLHLHYSDPNMHTMNWLIKRVLLVWLPRLLRMRRSDDHSKYISLSKPKGDNKVGFQHVCFVTDSFCGDPWIHTKLERAKACSNQFIHSGNPPKDLLRPRVENILTQISVSLKQITDFLDDRSEQEKLESDWKFAAKVLDKACLLFFGAIFLAVIVYVSFKCASVW